MGFLDRPRGIRQDLAIAAKTFLVRRSTCQGPRRASRSSSCTSPGIGTKSFSLVANAFLQAKDPPLRNVLTEEEIHAAFVAENACSGEDDIYTPALTLWEW